MKQVREKIEGYVPAKKAVKKAPAKAPVKAASKPAEKPAVKLQNPVKNEEAADISDQIPHVDKEAVAEL